MTLDKLHAPPTSVRIFFPLPGLSRRVGLPLLFHWPVKTSGEPFLRRTADESSPKMTSSRRWMHTCSPPPSTPGEPDQADRDFDLVQLQWLRR